MRDTETSLIVKSDIALLLFLDTVCAGVENDLAKVLEPEYVDEVIGLNAKSNELREKINKFKAREIIFYTTVRNKLSEFVGEHRDQQIVLFFDIDETIVKKVGYGNDAKDIMRPSLGFLFKTLRIDYPNIMFGICSSRGKEYVDLFIQEYTELGFSHGFSSRNLSTDAPDDSWGEYCSNGHYNKAHAMIELRKQYGDFCYLVDDIIDVAFEQKKMGICIKGGEFYGFPEV